MRFLVVFLFFLNSAVSQDKYPKDYFRSPMDIPLSAAGYFGELRPNHFHSGVDFRTEKREGIPVYATADGYVSRIKISIYGYGKAIYIDHPNGFTTVYGHLQKAAPGIQEVISKEQYLQKNYEIEIRPQPNEIPVKKGDLIAFSGNTGGSSGPHLHFEFRDTKTEKIINPMLFGFGDELKDSKAPQVSGLIVYPLSDAAQVNGSAKPVFLSLSLQKDGTYLSGKIIASGKIGFGINAFDTSDSGYGKKGIYMLDSYLNGMPYFGYEFDIFSFDETKYVNTFIDYLRYQKQGLRFQKLFVGDHYPSSIIKTMKNNGIVDVSTNLTLTYKMILQDFHGNKTTVSIPIIYGVLPITQPKEEIKTAYFLKSKIDNSYTKDNVTLFVPENAFYEDFYLNFEVKNNELFFHNDSVPLQENVTITFDVSKIPPAEREKMFIANLDGKKAEYNKTYKKENVFNIYTKKLGKFFLMKDVAAPKIYNASFKEGDNLDAMKTLRISISDNLSGIKEYNAYLNGNWILMEYESKLNRLTHNFSDSIYQNGRNDFKIIVKDNLENTTTFETHFFKTK